jgi:hypothetical protein
MTKTIGKFVAESFVNEEGQTINPGDDVLCVYLKWKSVGTRKAKYLGFFEYTGWNGRTYKRAKIEWLGNR